MAEWASEVILMWRWRRKLIETNNRMGPIATVLVNIATWLFAYFLVVYLHRLGYRLRWLHSSSSLTIDDFVCAVLTGVVVGLYEWADRDKKREMEERRRQGFDATMI